MLNLSKRRAVNVIAIILSTVILVMSCMPVTTLADVEGWEGWTEDNIEDAWSVYVITSWNDVLSLQFTVSENGSYANAKVPDDFRTKYEGIIRNILSDYPYPLMIKSSTNNRDHSQYTELILAIAYELYSWGLSENVEMGTGITFNEFDVCFLSWFINKDYANEFNSVEDCFYELIRLYYVSERYYLLYHPVEGQDYSIYNNNDQLAVVIQGTLYGSKYTQDNVQYTIDNADEFFKAHKDEINATAGRMYTDITSMSRFASKVGNTYSAVRSVDNKYVIG